MSIQRYVAGFAPNMAPALLKYAEGDAVLFTDHETMERAMQWWRSRCREMQALLGEAVKVSRAQAENFTAMKHRAEAAEAKLRAAEGCNACPHDPDTCDRAECPAWGKSEEAKARILSSEANRPLTDEEHAIVDAGYERGKRILAEVRAEDRERRLEEALRDLILVRDEEAQHGKTPVSRDLWKRAWRNADAALSTAPTPHQPEVRIA